MPPRSSIDSLTELAKKWKTTARDAAEEVWTLVKDSNEGGNNGDSNDYFSGPPSPGSSAGVLAQLRGGFEKPWGWAGEEQHKENWGWAESEAGRSAYGDDSELPSPQKLVQEMTRGAKPSPSRKRYDRYDLDDGGGAMENDRQEGDSAEVSEPVWNIGTMLGTMGVPKEVLGWDDGEECFLDK